MCYKVLTDSADQSFSENPNYCPSRNAIVITQNSLKRKIENIYKDRNKFIQNLDKRAKLKNVAKRISKEEYDNLLTEFDSEFMPQVECFRLLGIEHLFNKTQTPQPEI